MAAGRICANYGVRLFSSGRTYSNAGGARFAPKWSAIRVRSAILGGARLQGRFTPSGSEYAALDAGAFVCLRQAVFSRPPQLREYAVRPPGPLPLPRGRPSPAGPRTRAVCPEYRPRTCSVVPVSLGGRAAPARAGGVPPARGYAAPAKPRARRPVSFGRDSRLSAGDARARPTRRSLPPGTRLAPSH